ncbi:MAG: tail fiber protein [Alphaproteobacteria bacterium]|nr:tail fiber protein [Alphaproteobacteria bacterium]
MALATVFAISGAREAQACAAEPLLTSICYVATTYCPAGYVVANGQTLQIGQYQAVNALVGTFYGGDGKTTFGVPDLRGRGPVGVTNSVTAGGTPISAISYGQFRGAEASILQSANLPQHTHPATFTPTGGGGGTAGQASGPVSLPVAVTVPSQAVSVSGGLKIANNSVNGVVTFSDNAVLAKGGGQASIYAPSSTTATNVIGPSQTFSGSLPTQTINTTASGTVTLPVTGGGGGITGGAVEVGPNTNATVPTQFTNLPPQIGLTACMAVEGIWPQRPN